MAKQQIHKVFTEEQVTFILEKYLAKEIDIHYALAYLKIGKTRFFKILRDYRHNPDDFTVEYCRVKPTRKIKTEIENNILKELSKEKSLIEDKETPIRHYNYSAVRDTLRDKYGQEVSLPTIIDRAKKNNFYLNKPIRKVHEREVITNYAGELLQHDSSHHRWSPLAEEKWYLVTTLDDYSRFLLYAQLVERETAWAHILALQSVILQYGCPFKYYPDQHSIFRYVKARDRHSPWVNYTKFTDEADPQWKRVLKDCGVEITYALSPQAKGKIERPYRWLQDRIFRTCAKNDIKDFDKVQQILLHEVHRYNYRQVHSTTQEIPAQRLERAIQERKSMFREFIVPKPFESTKDIFCLRTTRIVDAYRKISLDGLELKVPTVPPRQEVEIKMVPDIKRQTVELRFWFRNTLVGRQTVKSQDLKIVQF